VIAEKKDHIFYKNYFFSECDEDGASSKKPMALDSGVIVKFHIGTLAVSLRNFLLNAALAPQVAICCTSTPKIAK
jgi:hypothetical protein